MDAAEVVDLVIVEPLRIVPGCAGIASRQGIYKMTAL